MDFLRMYDERLIPLMINDIVMRAEGLTMDERAGIYIALSDDIRSLMMPHMYLMVELSETIEELTENK